MVTVPVEQRDFCRLPDQLAVHAQFGANPGHGQRERDAALPEQLDQTLRPLLAVSREHGDFEALRR